MYFFNLVSDFVCSFIYVQCILAIETGRLLLTTSSDQHARKYTHAPGSFAKMNAHVGSCSLSIPIPRHHLMAA